MAIRLGSGRRQQGYIRGATPYERFLWFVSLSFDKEMNITGCSVEWFVRSFFVTKRLLEINERTANIVFLEKIIVFISLSRDKETNQMKTCFAARNSKFFLLAKRASRKARTKNVARTGLPPLSTPPHRVLTPTLRVG